MQSPKNKSRRLDYHGVYPCPVCRLGQLSTLSLMDALACDCCHHIFTTEPERQLLKMADRQPPLTWRWSGRNWTAAHLEGVEWGWIYWLFAIALVALPTTLVGLAAYMFPPDPSSRLAWLPTVWTGLVFLSHLSIVGWLVIEFYQFPVWAYLRIRRQQWLGR
jgi:hypothetical protein